MRSIEAMPGDHRGRRRRQSDLWLQIVSDICEVRRSLPLSETSYGDAFSGLGAGLFDAPDAIHGWLANARTVTPNRALAALYDRYHDIYLRLYQQNRQAMHELHDLA